MNQIVWLIISAAVLVAVSGILLFLGTGGLSQFDNDSNSIKNSTLENWISHRGESSFDLNQISQVSNEKLTVSKIQGF